MNGEEEEIEEVEESLVGIIQLLRLVLGREKWIMATLQQVSDAVDAIGTGVGNLSTKLTDVGTSLTAEIKKLDDIIAALKAGGTINPADLDAIVAKLKTQADGLTTLATTADALKTQADQAT